ncbi:unnamed protein product [Polarella glacialis]|uniref:Uncharacterized protein n=1 Tax=Polarella glacialis TaxID=89957 RepID=A0A813KDE3_POLGL|nr:unnamed protein product [Polarella glacialis]
MEKMPREGGAHRLGLDFEDPSSNIWEMLSLVDRCSATVDVQSLASAVILMAQSSDCAEIVVDARLEVPCQRIIAGLRSSKLGTRCSLLPSRWSLQARPLRRAQSVRRKEASRHAEGRHRRAVAACTASERAGRELVSSVESVESRLAKALPCVLHNSPPKDARAQKNVVASPRYGFVTAKVTV